MLCFGLKIFKGDSKLCVYFVVGRAVAACMPSSFRELKN